MPEPLPIHNKFFPDVYRYAFLMTGSVATATEVLRSAVEGASRGASDEDAKPGYAKRWLFAKARELCRHPHLLRTTAPGTAGQSPTGSAQPAGSDGSDAAMDEDPTLSSVPSVPGETALPVMPAADDAANAPHRLAAFLALLPEKERSALVMFYLYRFNLAEMAEILDIKPGELGPLLNRARASLQQHKLEHTGLLVQPSDLPAEFAAE